MVRKNYARMLRSMAKPDFPDKSNSAPPTYPNVGCLRLSMLDSNNWINLLLGPLLKKSGAEDAIGLDLCEAIVLTWFYSMTCILRNNR